MKSGFQQNNRRDTDRRDTDKIIVGHYRETYGNKKRKLWRNPVNEKEKQIGFGLQNIEKPRGNIIENKRTVERHIVEKSREAQIDLSEKQHQEHS